MQRDNNLNDGDFSDGFTEQVDSPFVWEDIPMGYERENFNKDGGCTQEPGAKASKPSERAEEADGPVTLNDFRAYMIMHAYIYMPTGDLWPGASVNSRIAPIPLFDAKGLPVIDKQGAQKTIPASQRLDKNRPVERMTWAPGHPMIINDRLPAEGGWIERQGNVCFNLYRPPTIKPGDPQQAGPWIDHIRLIYPDYADHIILWLAFKVQHPEIKINHALVLGGEQGIGKDSLLVPIQAAVGEWNFTEVSPIQLLGRFNGFVKSVILRVSEARDLGEVNRFAFYDHTKTLIAAPPNVLRCDEKNLREHSVFNVCGVIITTNHKSDGIYLPADDRRHYATWSEKKKAHFDDAYWNKIHAWYENGGIDNVCAYLRGLDISGFNPKAPPPKTPAWWEIVDANSAPEDAEIADAIDLLGKPSALTIGGLVGSGVGKDFEAWIEDRKNRRALPHRLERCGYTPVRNDNASDGLWKLNGRRQAVYAKADISYHERLAAVKRLGG